MFFTTSRENFEQYLDQYNANQAGLSNGYLMESDLEAEMIIAGWEKQDSAPEGASSSWKKNGDDEAVIFEHATGEEDAYFEEIRANLEK